MPVHSQRSSTSTQDTSSQSDAALDWDSEVSTAVSNAEVVAMVSGQSVDEASATSMLDAAQAEQGEAKVGDAPERRVIPDGISGEAFVDHDERVRDLQLRGGQDWNLNFFRERWTANKARYERVAAQTGVPAVLVAAIHFRESSMNFGTYLHQGDPLGRAAVHVPKNIPIFHDWEKAAVHALNLKRGIRDSVGMDENTTDLAAMATYSEAYNGFGYRYKGVSSAYVYAGTNQYSGGRYVADGKFDKNSWDHRPGTMALVSAVDGGEVSDAPLSEQTSEDAWQAVVSGNEVLRLGQRQPSVKALQQKLDAAGYDCSIDGDFGPRTRSAVIAFQTDHGLTVDGVVGRGTAAALDSGSASTQGPATNEADNGPAVEPEVAERSAAWQSVESGRLLLKRGDRGDGVRDLQQLLKDAGHELAVDGDFGPATRRVVQAFQRAAGLAVDGIVGRKTAQAL